MQEQKNLRGGELLTDIVIGMSDGLTVPFALAAGLSGVVDSNNTILIAGIAGITAGAIAMAAGGYSAGKSEMSNYPTEPIQNTGGTAFIPGDEKEEVKRFFANLGLSAEMQEQAAEEISKDRKNWVELIAKYQPEAGNPGRSRPARAAMTIGLSYAIGGLVPLSPYFFTDTPMAALKISAVITLISLFIFGFSRSRITGINPWLGALRATIFGALAALAAYGVASFFKS